MVRYLKRLCAAIGVMSTALGTLAALFLIGLSGFIVVCVVLRYVFNAPFIHTDELVGYLFSGVSLFALAYCLKIHEHIRADIVISKIGGKIRRATEVIVIGLGTVWLVIMAIGGVGLWLKFVRTRTFSYEFLHVDLWIATLPLLVGLSVLALQGVAEWVTTLTDFRSAHNVSTKDTAEGEEQS